MKKLIRNLVGFACLLLASGDILAQTADFTMDRVSGCDPLVVSFTNKSTGTITSYYWEFGDSKTSTLPSPSTTYTGPGTYTVKLTVRNGSGPASSKTATVTVYPSPKVSFTASPASACPCTEITFTNTSVPNAPGSYTSIWSFGDGYTATTNNTTHVYCTPGSYNVALKVTNSAGCESAKVDTAKVVINEKPVGSFYGSKTSLCKLPDTVTFTNMVTKGKAPYTFSWDFGDPPTSTAPGPSHIYSTAGTYTVRMIVTDANGCKDTVTKTNYITASTMNSDFKVPSSICAGVSMVRFDNISTPTPVATNWYWSDGGGATGLYAQRNFWKGNTYTVTMIDSFGPGCKDTAVHTYTVYPKPKPNFSYWPIYPCPAPVDVHFTDKSVGADSILWIFGDGTTSKLKDPVHTYTHDSVFTVWMIAKSDKGCLDTFRVRDTTKDFPLGYPKPFYDSSNSPVIVRVFDEYMVIKKTQDSSCIPAVASFTVELRTNTHLPSAVDTSTPAPTCATITGYTLPYWYCSMVPSMPDPYPDPFYDSKKPGISDPFYYPYPIRTYLWDFGDGSPTSTAANPSHTYLTEGRFKITCTVTTDSCTFTDTIFTEAGFKPHADFSFYPAAICKGDYAFFTNLSTGGLRYIWDFADTHTLIDTAKNVSHRFEVYGDRRVKLTADRYGCADTISKLLVINPPGSYFGMKYSCDTPLKVQFIDSSYRATGVLWDFGDGSPRVTTRNPVHIYSSAGTYTVTQMTTNDSFSCKDTLTRTIELFTAKATFTASNGCLGDTTFFNHTNPNYIISYAFSAAVPIKDLPPARHYGIFKDTGVYTIIMYTKDSHGCFDTLTKKDYVTISRPRMKIVASPAIACAPALINFTDSSTNVRGVKNVTRTWYWGDATSKTDTSTKASKLFTTPGSYPVLVVTTDAQGCKDSTTITIEASKPIADFVYDIDTYSCMDRPIKFYNTSTGTDLSFKWYFGDGGTSTDASPVYKYKTVGAFTVKLVITDKAGCKDSLSKANFVRITQPDASFVMDDSIALCPPLFVKFKNTSTNAVRYEWDFDNMSTSTASDPVTPYIDRGVYDIVMIAYDKHGCTDTAYGKARVMGYAGAFKYNPLSGCAPHTVNFEADLLDAEVMVWDFADGVTESATAGKLKTSHTYTEPGSYVPRLILGDGKGCSTSSQGLDTIKVDGIIPEITTSPTCVGVEVTFTDNSKSYFSDYASSEWIFDDGTKETGKVASRTFSKTGTYPIRLITRNTNGCIDTLDQTITIYDLPVIKAIDTVICLGDKATLAATGGVSYVWQSDPTLSCTNCNNPVTSTRVPRKYYVRGTDVHGCVNRDTLDVGIKTKTTLILAENADVCLRDSIQLVASGAQQYSWTPDTYLSASDIPNPIAKPDTTVDVTYRVIGTEGSCIPDTGFLKLTVRPLPEVNAGADQKVLAGTEVQLNGTGKSVKDYLWTPATSLSCTDCPNPVAKPLVTTTFTLRGNTEYGCTDSDDVTIVVFCDQSQLFIPNTFTPNGDGQNDYFYPQGKGVGKIKSFIVYNRWGQKVFTRTNMDANIREQGWDGSFNGDMLSPDTFVYTIEATCDNGETVFWKGDVTLIK